MSVRTRRAGGGGGGSSSSGSSARASSDDGIEDPFYSKTGGKKQKRGSAGSFAAGLLLATVAVASVLAVLVIKVGFERRRKERLRTETAFSFEKAKLAFSLVRDLFLHFFFRFAAADDLFFPSRPRPLCNHLSTTTKHSPGRPSAAALVHLQATVPSRRMEGPPRQHGGPTNVVVVPAAAARREEEPFGDRRREVSPPL